MSEASVRIRPFNAVVATASTWAVVIGGVAAALAVVLDFGRDAGSFWVVVGVPAVLAFVLAFIRVKLEVDRREIRIFNVVRPHRIPWDAVQRLGVVHWWLSPSVLMVGSAAIRLTTQSGRRIVIDASTTDVPRVLGVLETFDPHATARGD